MRRFFLYLTLCYVIWSQFIVSTSSYIWPFNFPRNKMKWDENVICSWVLVTLGNLVTTPYLLIGCGSSVRWSCESWWVSEDKTPVRCCCRRYLTDLQQTDTLRGWRSLTEPTPKLSTSTGEHLSTRPSRQRCRSWKIRSSEWIQRERFDSEIFKTIFGLVKKYLKYFIIYLSLSLFMYSENKTAGLCANISVCSAVIYELIKISISR